MKGKVKRLLAASFAITLLASGTLNSAAAENEVISVDFGNSRSFAALGDLDVDGKLASSDLTLLRKILLKTSDEGEKYANVNGDEKINIRDLVRLKKDIADDKKPAAVVDGALELNGTAYYTDELVSLMKPNTEYQITYKVASENGIEISVKGAKADTVVYNSGKGTKTFSHILKTGETLTPDSGLELALSGVGTIDEITVNEITDSWFDGDTAEQGSNDIF